MSRSEDLFSQVARAEEKAKFAQDELDKLRYNFESQAEALTRTIEQHTQEADRLRAQAEQEQQNEQAAAEAEERREAQAKLAAAELATDPPDRNGLF